MDYAPFAASYPPQRSEPARDVPPTGDAVMLTGGMDPNMLACKTNSGCSGGSCKACGRSDSGNPGMEGKVWSLVSSNKELLLQAGLGATVVFLFVYGRTMPTL